MIVFAELLVAKKPWKRVTICLSGDEHSELCMLAGLKKDSISSFIRYLLKIHIEANRPIFDILKVIQANSANQESP